MYNVHCTSYLNRLLTGKPDSAPNELAPSREINVYQIMLAKDWSLTCCASASILTRSTDRPESDAASKNEIALPVLPSLPVLPILDKTTWIKGSERVMSSDPPCKDGKARFITVLLNLCLIKYEFYINVNSSQNWLFSIVTSLLRE